MPDISRLLKRHARWLRTYMLCKGDTLQIVGAGFIDRRYGRERLVVKVKDSNGVTRYLPLNARNLRTLARALGTDTSRWLGRKIRVRGIRFYPTINSEAPILEPIIERPGTEKNSGSPKAEIKKTGWRREKYGRRRFRRGGR